MRLRRRGCKANLVGDMTVDSIKEARDTAPFKPFVIRTADGKEGWIIATAVVSPIP